MSVSRITPRPIGRGRTRRLAIALSAGATLAGLGASEAMGAPEPAAVTAPGVGPDGDAVPSDAGPDVESVRSDVSGTQAPLAPAEAEAPDSEAQVLAPSATAVPDVFSSNFSDGLSEFRYRTNVHRISVVDDPVLGTARKALRFRVFPGDTGPTSNPRAQLETPYDFRQGNDRYIGFSINLARDFPTRLPSRAWVTLFAAAYGPPYAGAGPVDIRVQNRGDQAVVRWQRNDTYDYDIPWSGPRVADVRGRWLDFVIRTKLHGDPNVGFVEMWMNTGSGWARQSLAGRSRLYMRTYDSTNNGGTNNTRINLYYRRDVPGPLTAFHGPLRIASASSTAFGAVAPTSYR